MNFQASSRHSALEQMLLDENAGPTPLPLSLLEGITNNFSSVHEIGRGGFAVVYKGMVGNEKVVAVKKLTRTHDLPESKFHKEVECLVKARHKNIVRFLGYCVETQGEVADCDGKFVISDIRNWLLCFEYLPNGSLDKYITDASGGLEWTERFRIIKGICEGLHYLHMNRILHLDLKPANILLDDHMVPKIADFGLSRCLDENSAHATTTIHMFGTPGYMAPEILYGGKITFASDIYSLGSIIMEILTGVKGYPEDENVNESWKNRLEGGNQLEQVSVCTKIGIECMEFNPEKRPDAQGIIDMLDKMASADKTATGSSLVGLQISLFNEQSLAESLKLQDDVNEHPETDNVAECLGNEGEENADHWSSREEQVDRKGTSISSSNSSLFDKLNILNVF
ncbi:hypothetical protein ACQJBY_018921 [Aegilops geniculata]